MPVGASRFATPGGACLAWGSHGKERSATFPGMKIAQLFGIDGGLLYEEMRRNIPHLNGADHHRLRKLVNPAFTPPAADRWRPAMRELRATRRHREDG